MSEDNSGPKSVLSKEPASVILVPEGETVTVRTDNVLSEVFDAFDRMFSGFIPIVELEQLRQATLEQTSDSIVATVSVPENVKKGDITVEVVDGYLYVDSRVEQWQGDGENRRLVGVEVLENLFTLPNPVDATKVEAKFENGVLIVTLPKTGSWTKKVQVD
ncbi:MAG: Hsp20/alpha crystallin family protein [Candidatus Vogelbacteria bacterium]|nr:Hsp20/alpha crystallin family protein [Candidatus Vogelbacteria bacterium]